MDKIEIAGREFIFGSFKADKSLRILECVAEIIDKCDLVGLYQSIGENTDQIFGELVSYLPIVMRKARPLLFRCLALCLIPDRELAELGRNEASLQARVSGLESFLMAEADLSQILIIATLAYKAVGIKNIRQFLPTLVGELRQSK